MKQDRNLEVTVEQFSDLFQSPDLSTVTVAINILQSYHQNVADKSIQSDNVI